MSTESAFDEEIIEIFVEEVGEVLEQIDINLPLWQADAQHLLALKEVRRAFHTLKGSGRMVQAVDIGELSWSVETLLNRLIDNSISVKPEMYELVFEVRKALPAMLNAFKNRQAAVMSGVNFARYIQQANDLVAGKPVSPLRGEVNEELSPEFLAHNGLSEVDVDFSSVPVVTSEPVKLPEIIVPTIEIIELREQVEQQKADIADLMQRFKSLSVELDIAKATLGAMPKASDPLAITRQLRQTDVEIQELEYFVKKKKKKMMTDNVEQQKRIETKLDRETKIITGFSEKIDADMKVMSARMKSEFANTVKMWSFVATGCSVMITLLLLTFLK